jgi:superfamily II DNA or RNA helicase
MHSLTHASDARFDLLLSRIEKLSAAERNLLRLKALFAWPSSKGDFLGVANRAFSSPGVLAWTHKTLNAASERLVSLRLLNPDFSCVESLWHPLTVEFLATPEGKKAAEALAALPTASDRQPWYSYVPQKDASFLRRLRLMLYSNASAVFDHLMNKYDKAFSPSYGPHVLATLFGETPLEMDWLTGLAPESQLRLFTFKIDQLLLMGRATPDVAAMIAHYREREGEADYKPFAFHLLRLDLLAGRFAVARRKIDALPGDKADAFAAPLLRGTVDFLEGHNDVALTNFRLALKIFKKERGKRKIFFDGMNGLFFLLALIRANDPALYPEAQTHLDAVEPQDNVFSPGFRAIQALLWLLQGLEPKARASFQVLRKTGVNEPFSSACVTLVGFLFESSLDQQEINESKARFSALRETLPLIARIHAEVLAKTAANPEPYKEFLSEFPEQGQVVAFTEIVQLRQPWERTFDSLANLITANAPRSAPPGAKKSKRLVWLLDPAAKSIEALEQSVKGKDWTLGRSVAMKRLHEQDPRLDYLTDHDRRALRTITKSVQGWYDEEDYSFDVARTLPALIGHPLVFDMHKRGQPLELIAYPVELAVTEQKAGYKFALTHRAKEPTVFLEAETPTRWRVLEFSAKLLQIQEVLGEKGLLVPRAGRDRVLALIKEKIAALPIRAEIAEADLPALEGRPEPVLQMAPLDEGLKAAMVVRPFGPAGPCFLPGLGAAFALAVVEGVGQRAKRDLDAESAAAAKALAALPALRQQAASGHEWLIADAESALELLVQIGACQPPLTVEWPEGKKWVARAEVSTASLSLKLGRSKDWFQVEGKVQVDDDLVLDMQDLLSRLDQAQGRFVPLADGSFLALTRRFQQQLNRLRGISEDHAKGLRVPMLGALAMQDITEEAGAVKADKEWKAFVARLNAAESRQPRPPTTLQAELRDYQLEGFQWLSRLAHWQAGACLADDMGLGKTVQAIAVMLEQAPQGPCLVISPTSVCHNWEKELSRFAPSLAVHKLGAAGGRAEIIAGLKAMDALVISYGLLHQEADRLAEIDWRMVVFDEAQAIKNAETRRAQAGQRLKAHFRLALTGTPIENYLDELWSLFNIVNPGLLGSRERFGRRFGAPIERNRDANALQALRALIRPFILRRTKSAVLAELPSRTEVTLEIDLPEEERAFYEAMRRRALEALAQLSEGGGKPGQNRIHILAEIMKLRRACCHPALVDPETVLPGAKLEAFLELVEDLIRNRHKALVFSQFVGQLERVAEVLRKRGIAFQYLDGSTPAPERARRVEAFQAGDGDLFLISLKAGGSGLNLTAADYVIHLDPWWNPAVEDQASDRAHRIGQSRPVTIYRLIARDSIEEKILDLHRAKRDLASDLLEGAEMSARLTDEDLLNLIRG